ncbi:SDR family NAD(P)-dependent oxidoreductase [Martelella endophytica]|uniref:3-oxoacyl-ACP reductase n=1 Tax=Martelella endophytica TaxID=1486262 RepID=A0A0D5LQU1_MAREN|nr:SDR family NAD(P)-dependent oxidoreductase [Martelella endophytica]AJY46594.1 3-oxoacyl-ACP reductase [Martelella endophytica]
MDLELQGPVALVTGSSRGIGEGIVRGLAQEGATVIVHGRSRAAAEAVAKEIVAGGGQAFAVTGDLTDDSAVENLVAEAISLAGPISILVNNAGGSGATEDWSTTRPETWSEGYDRNVLAALRVTTRVLPGMREAGWGRVINISSMAALMPPFKRPDYAAAKAAMITMTSSLAKAVATEGITANCVSPGTIRSDSLEKAFRTVASNQGMPPETTWQKIEEKVLPLFADVAMRRVGTLAEISDAIAFLASPRASYITGTNLRLDGGMWPGL